MATTTKDKVADPAESDDPVVLRARIRELEAKQQEPEKPRKGWRIITPIANYEGSVSVPGEHDKRVTLRFQAGEAFTDDVVAARHYASDFGYFTDPAFPDIDVHPTFIDPITREVREWVGPEGQHKGSGVPAGFERRYAVRA